MDSTKIHVSMLNMQIIACVEFSNQTIGFRSYKEPCATKNCMIVLSRSVLMYWDRKSVHVNFVDVVIQF